MAVLPELIQGLYFFELYILLAMHSIPYGTSSHIRICSPSIHKFAHDGVLHIFESVVFVSSFLDCILILVITIKTRWCTWIANSVLRLEEQNSTMAYLCVHGVTPDLID